MSSDVLISNLQKVGWKDFAIDSYLKVDFDHVGKAKISRNNWFVLIKSVSVLNAAELEFWNSTYKMFLKKSLSGWFSSGKYFVLILLADSIDADVMDRLGQEDKPDLLIPPKPITNGGGYTLVSVKDRRQIFMPKTVKLWDVLRASDFTNRTNQALGNYLKSLVVAG